MPMWFHCVKLCHGKGQYSCPFLLIESIVRDAGMPSTENLHTRVCKFDSEKGKRVLCKCKALHDDNDNDEPGRRTFADRTCGIMKRKRRIPVDEAGSHEVCRGTNAKPMKISSWDQAQIQPMIPIIKRRAGLNNSKKTIKRPPD